MARHLVAEHAVVYPVKVQGTFTVSRGSSSDVGDGAGSARADAASMPVIMVTTEVSILYGEQLRIILIFEKIDVKHFFG